MLEATGAGCKGEQGHTAISKFCETLQHTEHVQFPVWVVPSTDHSNSSGMLISLPSFAMTNTFIAATSGVEGQHDACFFRCDAQFQHVGVCVQRPDHRAVVDGWGAV